MKIDKENIRKYAKTLSKLPPVLFDNAGDLLFFPIDDSSSKDFDGITVDVISHETGSKKVLTPGIIAEATKLEDGRYGSNEVYLAYGSLDYSPKFDFEQCMSFLDLKHNKKDELFELECYAVKEEYIRTTFRLL